MTLLVTEQIIPWYNSLTDVFNTCIIAVNHEVEWPPRSPDLTHCDLFLWGYLRSKVHSTPPANAQDLMERIFILMNLND